MKPEEHGKSGSLNQYSLKISATNTMNTAYTQLEFPGMAELEPTTQLEFNFDDENTNI